MSDGKTERIPLVSAQMMCRILVHDARGRNHAKRGGSAKQISLDEGLTVSEERSTEVGHVHEALEQAEFDPRKSQIVELRFFGGLSIKETVWLLRNFAV